MNCALLYVENGISDEDLTFSGRFLPDELKKKLLSIESIDDVCWSVPDNYTGKLSGREKCFRRTDNDDTAFWKKLFSDIKADNIIRICCDSPFIDTAIINDMLAVHTKYLAEFTYSENLPQGFSCEIISKELVSALPDTEEKTLPLNQVIRSNINQFDVELYYREPDIRDKRLSFRSGNPREKMIMERILAVSGSIPQYEKIREIIDNNPHILYLSPTYIEIELTGRCDLDCIFCYRGALKKIRGDMDAAVFRKILAGMSSFRLPYSICLGGSGEPLMHEKFYEIMDLALNESLLQNIIIETNGIYADNNFKNYIKNKNAGRGRIKIIFNVNGMNNETYTALHSKDYFEKVAQNIKDIRDAVADKESIYVQIMKISETESFLDKYYDFWEKNKIPIILQKQNTYIGKIKDRRYSDLSPLERTPCWHLQRDMNILCDGRICFCRQDIDGELSGKNISEQTIEEIWKQSEEFFIKDYKKNYSQRPDCKSCDEWYTFNL